MTEQDLKEFIQNAKTQGEQFLHKELPKRVEAITFLIKKDLFSYESYKAFVPDMPQPLSGNSHTPDFNPDPQNNINLNLKLNLTKDCDGTLLCEESQTITNEGDSKGDVKNVKVTLVPHKKVLSNAWILEMLEDMKPVYNQYNEDLKNLDLWVRFSVPKIEDGNNFGVSVQEDALLKISYSLKRPPLFCSSLTDYFLTRGRLVVKATKHGYVEDYLHAIKELDLKVFNLLSQKLVDIRSQYIIIYDYVVKNLDKIKKPRSPSNNNSLY